MYRVFQKTDTQFYFWDNFGNSVLILAIFYCYKQKFMARKLEVFLQPHLYCVTTLPSKTNTVEATVISENRQHIKISIS